MNNEKNNKINKIESLFRDAAKTSVVDEEMILLTNIFKYYYEENPDDVLKISDYVKLDREYLDEQSVWKLFSNNRLYNSHDSSMIYEIYRILNGERFTLRDKNTKIYIYFFYNDFNWDKQNYKSKTTKIKEAKNILRRIGVIFIIFLEISLVIFLFNKFVFDENIFTKPISMLSLFDIIKILIIVVIIVLQILSGINILIKNWKSEEGS